MRARYWAAFCAASGEVCGHRHQGSRQGAACARRMNRQRRVRSVIDAWYSLEFFRRSQPGAREGEHVLDQARIS